MLLNEINDPNRQAQLASALANMHAQNRPRPKPSQEQLDDRKRKNDEFNARRDRVEAALEPIAQKYSGDQFEQFRQEVESTISPEELKAVDIASAFRRFNPEAKAAFAKSWDDYGKDRDASALLLPVPIVLARRRAFGRRARAG